MNPVNFREIGLVGGFYEPAEEGMAAADPSACPRRGSETTSRSGFRWAECTLLSDEAGRSVGVDEDTCRICICHGPADPSKNPALQKHICQVAFSGTIAGIEAEGPAQPSAAEVDKAIANVRRWRGDRIARGFVDALVFHGSITPERGAQLAASFALEEALT